MDDCLSDDPRARPTFEKIISSGSLSPEEMNITLDNLLPPQEWGEPFAHGSTASIYRARVRNSRSTIAVKRLNVPLNNATSIIMNERITYLVNNRHPNLAKYYGSYCSPLTSLIFMEYLVIGDLYSAIHSEQKKSFVAWDAQGRSIAKNIADGLAFLHSLEPPLVHFDLKSKNILLGSNLVAKIADLDSARAQPNMQLSVHSSTKKTLQWTAPELFSGKHVSKKVDVYSLAIVIWEILTQQIPWDGMIEFEVMGKLFNGQRPDIPPTASSHIRVMLEKGWANNPDQRLSAEDIADAMQEELDRHLRSLLRDSQYLSRETSSLPEELTQPVVKIGRQRAPSSPIIRSAVPVDEPPNVLRRKGSIHDSPSLSPRASLRRTRSIDNLPDAIFTAVTLSPQPPPRVLKRTESESLSKGLRSRSEITSRAHLQMRLDSRTENRNFSRTDGQGSSRTDFRSTEGSRTDSRTTESSKTDSSTDSRADSSTENRPESRPEATPDSKTSSTIVNNENRQDVKSETTDSRRQLHPSRILKRSDTNPNMAPNMNLLQRTLKRADSNPNMQSFRNLLHQRSDLRVDARSDSRSESRSDSRSDSRTKFSFTRSESGIGLRYQIAPKMTENDANNDTNSTDNISNHILYNKDGYNTGEIHREQIDQFNASYLDEYIDNVTPKFTPRNSPQNPFPASEGTATDNNYENEYDNTPETRTSPTESDNDNDKEQESGSGNEDDKEDYYYEEEEEEGEGEGEDDENSLRESSMSYEVNGDVSVDENGDDDYEERQKEEQSKYLEVKSDPDTADDFNDSGSASILVLTRNK